MTSINKILVVEDSELLHRMYDLILLRYTKDGTELIHAYNGKEALERLSAHPDTDLIILDINMPIMSGLEFLRYRVQENVFREIPVIIVSTEGAKDDTIRGLRAGAKGYVTKPFQATDLSVLIERILPIQSAESPVSAGAVAGIHHS